MTEDEKRQNIETAKFIMSQPEYQEAVISNRQMHISLRELRNHLERIEALNIEIIHMLRRQGEIK